MNLNEQQLETIELYLHGQLTGEAHSAFEQKLATDPEFAEQVKWIQEVEHALTEEADAAAFQKQLTTLGNTYFAQKRCPPNS